MKRVRAGARGDGQPPTPWQSRRAFDDPVTRFIESLVKVKGEAEHVPTLDAALDRLGAWLDELGARCVVANDEPPLSEAGLAARWPGIEWHVVGQTEADLRAICASADVGLSSADAALAETGSLLVLSGPGKSRLATLLPPVHLALVPVERLVTDLVTWTAQRPDVVPANLTFISGPSKTADIEQTLAIGVHGPKRFIVILYG